MKIDDVARWNWNWTIDLTSLTLTHNSGLRLTLKRNGQDFDPQINLHDWDRMGRSAAKQLLTEGIEIFKRAHLKFYGVPFSTGATKARKSVKSCIFCDRVPVTKEHIWSEWIHDILPKDTFTHTNYRMEVLPLDENTMVARPVSPKTRPGDVMTKKVRVVCGECNSGWMSIIDNAAKSIMAPMITGQRALLSPSQQQAMAVWMTLKTIVAEFDHEEFVAISFEDRVTFHKSKQPFPCMKIWVGYYGGTENRKKYEHTSLPMYAGEDPRKSISHWLVINSQATLLVIGNLVIFAMSSEVPALIERFCFTGRLAFALQLISPLAREGLNWPSATVMTDDDLAELRVIFSDVIGAVSNALASRAKQPLNMEG